MMRLRHALFASLSLAAITPAQAPFMIETDDPSIMRWATELVGHKEPLPQLGLEESWRLRMKPTGDIVVDVAHGLITRAHIVVFPQRLERLAPRFEATRELIRTSYTSALGQAGFAPEQAAEFVDSVLSLPSQIKKLRILIRGTWGSPEGLSVELWPTALPETWLGEFMASVRPTPFQVPSIADQDTTFSLRLGLMLHDEHLHELAEPVIHFIDEIRPKQEGDETDAHELVESFFGSMGGHGAIRWNAARNALAIAWRVSNSSELQKMVQSAEFGSWLQSPPEAHTRTNSYDAEKVPFERLPFVVGKTTIEPQDDEMRPLPIKGEITTHTGVAGRYFIGAFGEPTEEVEKLVKKAIQNKFPENKLGDRVFARIRMRLAEYAEQMTGDSAGLPERVSIALGAGVTVRHDMHIHPGHEHPSDMFIKILFQ